ncbi:MAG: DUF4430 domain-containing protein [Peptococcaceae bacterium]|jgi:hypothetical protein|nr:DUF4430 domain-containing protein [Peptococcaceae bacterium]
MRKHRTKIITTAAVIGLLAAAWMFGGNYANRGGADAAEIPSPAVSPAITAMEARGGASAQTQPPRIAEESPPQPAETAGAGAGAEAGEAGASPQPQWPPEASKEASGETSGDASAPPAEQGASAPETSAVMIIDPETGKDKYLTDPVPSGKPLPVEPQDTTLGGGEFTATLTVRCDTILDNMDLLDREKWELIPSDGVIFAETTVTFYEGESVFNVLQREMKRARIHMEFMNTPIYNSAYIEGIHNLYEFDVGELSGWMYKVNGWYPNYGCSRYQLKDGDAVEWHYTCDLGRDLGVTWIAGATDAQRDE